VWICLTGCRFRPFGYVIMFFVAGCVYCYRIAEEEGVFKYLNRMHIP